MMDNSGIPAGLDDTLKSSAVRAEYSGYRAEARWSVLCPVELFSEAGARLHPYSMLDPKVTELAEIDLVEALGRVVRGVSVA